VVKRLAGKSNPRDRNGIQVIARAAEILRALEGSDGLSLGQLADESLAQVYVQRIIAALDSRIS